MKNIEEEFKKALKKAGDEISQHLDKAKIELEKAVKVSERYGVPCYFYISFLGQYYKPESFDEKWKDLDKEDLFDHYDFPEYNGWQHSDVC